MTELKLYKFINDNNIEYQKYYNEVYIFVPLYLLEKFNKMLSYCFFDDDGLECILKHEYICIPINYICDYYDINPENIFLFECE